jgi:protocatechuate 3,4-dioxygenase beta subunit
VKLSAFSAVVLLLFSTLVCSAQVALPVVGKVVDTNGGPIPGIAVTIAQAACECTCDDPAKTVVIATTTTGEDGSFKLASADFRVQDGYIIVAAHSAGKMSGWVTISTSSSELPEAADLASLTITASPLRSVAGIVVDNFGKPMAGVKVSYGYFSGKRTSSWPDDDDGGCVSGDALSPILGLKPTVTDSEGKFALSGVPEHLSVEPLAEVAKYAVSKTEDAKITVILAGSISGRIVDAKGEPIAGAEVSASDSNCQWDNDAKTGSDGSFTIGELGPAGYSISVSVPKGDKLRYDVREGVVVTAGETTEVGAISLPSSVVFSGKVVDETTGKPIPGADVSLYSEEFSSHSSPTDAQGMFKSLALPGMASISVDFGDYPYPADSEQVQIPSKGKIGHIIRVAKAHKISGTVFDPSGKPAAGVRVTSFLYSNKRVTTDSAGKFSITMPGNSESESYYRPDDKPMVYAYDRKAKLGAVATIDPKKPGTALVLKLAPLQTVTLTVKDQSGAPMSDVDASLWVSFGNVSSGGSSDSTGSDGKVVFDNLIPGGRYSFGLNKSGYVQETEDDRYFRVGGEGWSPEMSIVMERSDFAKGKAVDEQGKPVVGVAVTTGDYPQKQAVTGANGEFTIELPKKDEGSWSSREGNVRLVAVDQNRKIAVVEFVNRDKLIAQGITLTLSPMATLKVHAQDPSGKPLKGVVVRLSTESEWRNVKITPATTDANGNAEVTGLYQGVRYWVHGSLSGYSPAPQSQMPSVGDAKWTGKRTITLARTNRVLRGKVVDNYDRPVKGAKVRVGWDDKTATRTDAKGLFVLRNLSIYETDISATYKGLQGHESVDKGIDFMTIVVTKPPKMSEVFDSEE